MHQLLTRILGQLYALQDFLADLEMRMRGGSLLIVYEGDEPALLSSLARASTHQSSTDDPSNADEAASDQASEDSIQTTDSHGTALPSTCLPFELRLIDFAHTRAAKGEGPDEGVRRGMGSVVRLVEGLLDDLDGWIAQEEKEGLNVEI